MRLAASCFDGRSAEAQAVELELDAEALVLHRAGAAPQRYARHTVVWPERTRHGQRQLLLPDGGVVALPDAAAWDDWAAAAGLSQPLAARWALHWHGVLAALLLLIALALGAWRWAIPWGAEQAVRWLPAEFERRLGSQLLADLSERGWLKDSTLPEATQQRIADAVDALARAAYPDQTLPRYRLHLRRGPDWLGPNAFALPGGDIVVTDALVELLPGQGAGAVSPALLGVIAHELGHVREQHGLRLVAEAGAVGALAGWWIGDYSSLLAAAPALMLQSAYSRDHERSADAEALRIMKAAGIEPRAMLGFFAALKKDMPERDGDSRAFGLASHPADSERVRFFDRD